MNWIEKMDDTNKEVDIHTYLWMPETLQLLYRIPQNLSNGLFSLGFMKFFGASLLKNKYRTFLKVCEHKDEEMSIRYKF